MIPPTLATIGNGVLSSLMAAGDSYSDISDYSYSDYSYFDYSDYSEGDYSDDYDYSSFYTDST